MHKEQLRETQRQSININSLAVSLINSEIYPYSYLFIGLWN